ncbi:hypothetical protein HY339_01635 [Candidatus Gottesmanbacteria bacterium]|nr:hypothetical protein [Candidatus Gottesmanbacteria bacterium]
MIDWETLTPLTALTHLDGRNSRKLVALKPYFSEFAWMKLRLRVMGEYLALISGSEKNKLHAIVESFSLSDATSVQEIERTTNHDLKALELFLAASLKRRGLFRLIPSINLGLGSEDINSIALGLQLLRSREEVIIPAIRRIIHALSRLSQEEKDTPMVARTHSQPANVTTLGKELAGPLSRLCDELKIFRSVGLQAKCSGEVGSFQAFVGVDRKLDWLNFTDTFVCSFGLIPTHAGTQVAPYDGVVAYLHSLFRINSILLDFTKNMWLYVLMGYVNVKKIDTEVGSAGMPHKVNPIYFEGAEGGLEMANGIIETLARKLPINRLQRDFSDSTVRRSLVMPIALSLLSYQSIVEGLSRIAVNRAAVSLDLSTHAEVWIETVKAYGLAHGIADMYERLKKATRGKVLSQEDLQDLITGLPLKEKEKQEMRSLCDGHHNPYPGRIVAEVVGRAKKI